MSLKAETTVGFFIVTATCVFLYMSFKIGSFRLDSEAYAEYSVYFNDISGLKPKSDVKIAGVKVGQVTMVDLVDNNQRVAVKMSILKTYALHTDAYATVRQDGLLGTKYLELIVGDPLLPVIAHGGTLTKLSKDPASIDALLNQFKTIASNVSHVTESFNAALGGPDGAERLRLTVQNLSNAAQSVADFSETMQRMVARNEGNMNGIIDDFGIIARELKDKIPALERNLDKISQAIDRDLNRVASQIESTAGPLREVMQKVNDGRGLLGQLINDDGIYKDIQSSIQVVKNYFKKIDKLSVVFDVHTETMYSRAEHYNHRDSKAYVNMRLYPAEDYFYLAGITASRKGSLVREEIYADVYDENKKTILSSQSIQKSGFTEFPAYGVFHKLTRNTFAWNLQFGKVFNNFAVRVGLFEGWGGIAFDYNVPIQAEKCRWVSTLEAFDFNGQMRIGDIRPHIKWLNKLFFTNNLYFVIGADDFVSKRNKSAFVGVGLRFADDDFKYYLSRANIS